MGMMKDNYARYATVVRVIDGDTVVMDVDLGFYLTIRMSCRLYGIDAPEVVGATAEAGKASRDHLMGLLPVGTPVVIESIKADKYAGRFDGIIMLQTVNINEQMVTDGYATRYEMR